MLMCVVHKFRYGVVAFALTFNFLACQNSTQRVSSGNHRFSDVTYNNDSPKSIPIYNELVLLAPEVGKVLWDPRLELALRELTKHVGADGAVDYGPIGFYLQKHGVIEPSPHLIVSRGGSADPRAVAQELSETISKTLSAEPYQTIAVATANVRGENVTIAALHRSSIKMRVPSRHANAGDVRISGNVVNNFSKPQVFVTASDGHVSHLFDGKKQAFNARFSCAGKSGKQQVEVTAEDELGTSVLANFAVWCGATTPPQHYENQSDLGPEPVLDSEQTAEALLLSVVNRERANHGVAPVSVDAGVAAVAKRHSIDMFNTGIVAHQSATTGSATDRVAAGGVVTAIVMENVARAYGVFEAHLGLMNSPGHRMNILSKDATHVGIGVVFGKKVGSQQEIFVTQVFVRHNPMVDVDAAAMSLASRLNKTWNGLIDQNLQLIAGRHAQDVASGISRSSAHEMTNQSLSQLGNQYGKLVTASVVTGTLEQVKPTSLSQGKTVRRFGVGIAQGNHPEFGKGAFYLVVIMSR